jgi:hypothetical protein
MDTNEHAYRVYNCMELEFLYFFSNQKSEKSFCARYKNFYIPKSHYSLDKWRRNNSADDL